MSGYFWDAVSRFRYILYENAMLSVQRIEFCQSLKTKQGSSSKVGVCSPLKGGECKDFRK